MFDCTYRRSTIFWNSILARTPLDLAWILVMIKAKRSSLISSSRPNRPALKNTWFFSNTDIKSLFRTYSICWCVWFKYWFNYNHHVHIYSYHKSTDIVLIEKKIINIYLFTLVCPSLYWLWSISKEPKSFSEAFLLSMNCPSGMALGFKIRYLLKSKR